MSAYIVITILISLSAIFSYVNYRVLKLPFVIGLFFLSILLSLCIIISKAFIDQPYTALRNFIEHIDISKFILNIMLGFLLFAGSLHVSWYQIKKQLKQITLFALGGVLLSTAIIACLFYECSVLLNLKINFIYCLLFGAFISPTDPIAVLGILVKANVEKEIETLIVGESLFNDGIGVVVFISLLEILQSGSNTFDFTRFGLIFLQEAAGGVLFGLTAGFILHYILNTIDHYETEVLVTLAFVTAGYQIAGLIHVSGPLAMVIMGMLIGNYKEKTSISRKSKEYVYKFWELTDVILNSILFILIAFVLVIVDYQLKYVLLGLFSILIVLVSRIIIVFVPKWLLPGVINLTAQQSKILIWGGLRGGLSIALVLSLPESETKHVLLVATYMCVVFSIIVQGLTIKKNH